MLPDADRHGRRRPFSNWMKRLTNLKNSSTNPVSSSGKRNGLHAPSKSKKNNTLNNPYPLSGTINGTDGQQANGHLSISEPANSERRSHVSRSEPSFSESGYEQQVPPTGGTKSTAPTLSTNADTTTSDTAQSKAGTNATATGGVSYHHDGGEGSTFSSPAPSVRSLTTTLTTVQSTAASNQLYGVNNQHAHTGGTHYTSTPQSATSQQTGVQFTHQFPTSPAPALPSHLNPHPTTYTTATANNLLTDNASVLTLASSSKRRRRNSLDTNASVRALAPSSIFSGSRESLPLSILSGNNAGNANAGTTGAGEASSASLTNSGGVLSRSGIASGERLSMYSTGGDRGSFSPMRQQSAGDAGSVKSSRHSYHGRNDSTTGSIGGVVSGQVGPVMPGVASGRVSRRGSGWGELSAEEGEDESSGHADGKGKERVLP